MAWAAAVNRLTRRTRDQFPQAAVYDPAGVALAVIGIFDEVHTTVEQEGDGPQLTTTRPVFEVRLADLSAGGVTPHVHDRLTIGVTTYEVYDVQPDGSGNVVLSLTQVV